MPLRKTIVLRSISASSDQQAGCGGVESMDWETHSVTPDRFEDFTDVVNRSRRVNHCWCLSHRLQAAEIERLGGGSREQAMRRLCEREHPPGVVTYLDGEPVGWCNIGPRTEITRLARSRLIRPVDDVPVWSIVCVIVRPGASQRRCDGTTAGRGGRVRGVARRASGGGLPRRPAGTDGPDNGVRRDEVDVRTSRIPGRRNH